MDQWTIHRAGQARHGVDLNYMCVPPVFLLDVKYGDVLCVLLLCKPLLPASYEKDRSEILIRKLLIVSLPSTSSVVNLL